jgi:hypothetical protein
MFNPRRYEIRVYLFGARVLPKDKALVGLDLSSGHGLQAAHVELDRMLMRIAAAAQIRPKDIKHSRVEVLDEETGDVVWNFYPPNE